MVEIEFCDREYWNADQEWPVGDFGFVWGGVWGDDSSWKLQYLDLSRVQEGIIVRDERFGYLELAVDHYTSPCLNLETTGKSGRSEPPAYIEIDNDAGDIRANIAVTMNFDVRTGKNRDWQRTHNSNWE